MTQEAILLINERDELKERHKFGDISKNDYNLIHKEQKERFNEMFTHPGLKLYNTIKNENLMNLTPVCRTSVLNGLTHFTEICIRVHRWDLGKEICNKIINELPQNYQKPFLFKLSKIDSLENPEKKINPFKRNEESDLAIRLREALNRI
jgi:hypothetical protein